MTFLVPVGAVVQEVVWESLPDKYMPPKQFATRAEVEKYTSQFYVWYDLWLTFSEGKLRMSPRAGEWQGEEIVAGDTVRRVEYSISRWEEYGGPLEFEDYESAVAACPKGRVTGVHQVLWIGPKEIWVVGGGQAIDKTGGDA